MRVIAKSDRLQWVNRDSKQERWSDDIDAVKYQVVYMN